MAVTLTVTAGPHAERTFAFDRHDTLLVGRAKDAHFQLSYDDPYFSRRHFLVEVREILQIPPPVLSRKLRAKSSSLRLRVLHGEPFVAPHCE